MIEPKEKLRFRKRRQWSIMNNVMVIITSIITRPKKKEKKLELKD